jgi:hypothetical protein
VVISVDAHEIRVGRASIEHVYIADCRALDAEQTSRRAGVEADARAHLVLRPYVKTAVEITLNDQDDPIPYWLVSSRRPQQLAAAQRQAASSTLILALSRRRTRIRATPELICAAGKASSCSRVNAGWLVLASPLRCPSVTPLSSIRDRDWRLSTASVL